MNANQELGSSKQAFDGSGLTLSVVGHWLGVQMDQNPWSYDDRKGYCLKTSAFQAHLPKKQYVTHFAVAAPRI